MLQIFAAEAIIATIPDKKDPTRQQLEADVKAWDKLRTNLQEERLLMSNRASLDTGLSAQGDTSLGDFGGELGDMCYNEFGINTESILDSVFLDADVLTCSPLQLLLGRDISPVVAGTTRTVGLRITWVSLQCRLEVPNVISLLPPPTVSSIGLVACGPIAPAASVNLTITGQSFLRGVIASEEPAVVISSAGGNSIEEIAPANILLSSCSSTPFDLVSSGAFELCQTLVVQNWVPLGEAIQSDSIVAITNPDPWGAMATASIAIACNA